MFEPVLARRFFKMSGGEVLRNFGEGEKNGGAKLFSPQLFTFSFSSGSSLMDIRAVSILFLTCIAGLRRQQRVTGAREKT